MSTFSDTFHYELVDASAKFSKSNSPLPEGNAVDHSLGDAPLLH